MSDAKTPASEEKALADALKVRTLFVETVGATLDAVHEHAVSLKASTSSDHARALELTANIPLCKTITDFCTHHGVKTFLDLDAKQRGELTHLMEMLNKRVEDYKVTMLRALDGEHVDALSDDDRAQYHASIHAFVLREDHYP